MQAVCVVYMGAVVRLVLEGDPIGDNDSGNCHSRCGEEDNERTAEDDASRQHPGVIIYARHLSREGSALSIWHPPSLKAGVIRSSMSRICCGQGMNVK